MEHQPARGTDDEREIRALDEGWSRALEAGDLEGVMANYAEDAVFLAPDTPIIEGREAIRARFAQRLATPGYRARFAPRAVVVAQSRDLAYETGVFEVTLPGPDGRPATRSGKHLVAWEKRAGRWRVRAESLNFDAP